MSNDPLSVEVTGTIEESVSHHSSVFSVSNMLHGSSCKEAVTVHYDTRAILRKLGRLSMNSGEKKLGHKF